MQIILEPTGTFVTYSTPDQKGEGLARLWVGKLDDGNEVQALILGIAVPDHPSFHQLHRRLASELVSAPPVIAWLAPAPAIHVVSPLHQ